MAERYERKRIGLDFDGVLVDTPWLKMAMAYVLFPAKYPTFALDRPSELQRLAPAELAAVETILYSSPHSGEDWLEGWSQHWRELKPIAGAKDGVQRLSAAGNMLYVVTKRGGLGVRVAEMLLQRWEVGGFEDIVGVGGGSKNSVAADLNLNVMVEDSLEVLKGMRGIVQHRLLFSQPYNRDKVPDEGITRVDDWPATCHYIGNIATATA